VLELNAVIGSYDRLTGGRFDGRAIERRVHGHVADRRALLTSTLRTDANCSERCSLVPLRFTQGVKRTDLKGTPDRTTHRRRVGLPTFMVAVRGFEPRSRG
jgi:hypothetical protein